MSDLGRRLRAAQMPQEAFQEDIGSWTMDMLQHETVAFGTKHVNRTFEDVWNMDQGWVGFVVQRFSKSEKMEHKKFIRFVELKLDEIESQRAQRPVLRRAPLPVGASKAAPKPKAGYQRPTASELTVPTSDDEDIELVTETYSAQIMTQEMAGMQERMQSIEGALQQVIQHLSAANPDVAATAENLL